MEANKFLRDSSLSRWIKVFFHNSYLRTAKQLLNSLRADVSYFLCFSAWRKEIGDVYTQASYWTMTFSRRNKRSFAVCTSKTTANMLFLANQDKTHYIWQRRLHVCLRLAPDVRFPAHGIGNMFSRPWRQLHVFPCFALVFFSRAWRQLHVFSRFARLAPVALFCSSHCIICVFNDRLRKTLHSIPNNLYLQDSLTTSA